MATAVGAMVTDTAGTRSQPTRGASIPAADPSAVVEAVVVAGCSGPAAFGSCCSL